MSASSPALPYTQSSPQAHIIASDAEALAIADEIAAVLKPGAAERDRTGIVPVEIVNTYSNSGLWGITVPRRFGGAEVSAATLAQVIAILSAADPSLGQIPQNHYCLLEDIRLQGSDDQQAFFFAQVLQGYRFANALSETGGKTVLDIRTRIVQGAEGLGINGRKGYCTGSLYAHWIGILALDADDRAQHGNEAGRLGAHPGHPHQGFNRPWPGQRRQPIRPGSAYDSTPPQSSRNANPTKP